MLCYQKFIGVETESSIRSLVDIVGHRTTYKGLDTLRKARIEESRRVNSHMES
jgi:hypothetical protein